MKNVVVVGSQWGDEGKGKIVDWLSSEADIVVRFQEFVNRRERTNITFVAYNDVIKHLIKATLARQLYDDNAFEEIVNRSDIMIDEVILLSKENSEFKQ